jgi:ribulose-phosphate 3-epimerase
MVVPALLTDKKDELSRMINICAGFTDYVQIDIMDGEFVPSKSVTVEDLRDLRVTIASEAHLMVKNPVAWLIPFKKLGAKAIIYHVEINADHQDIIKRIKGLGLRAGIAVNPPTRIEDFQGLVKDVDCVLFMSVNPGFYGAPFVPEVLGKIKKFKQLYPKMKVGIDGGVKQSNVDDIIKSGVDFICVGSAILTVADPGRAYKEFLAKFKHHDE